MKKAISLLILSTLLSGCADFKEYLRTTRFKSWARETVTLSNGYTCDKDAEETIKETAHNLRKAYEEQGKNIYLNDALNQVCNYLDGSIGREKDKHVNIYELQMLKYYEVK